MTNSERIRIEQEKLEEIRAEAARKVQEDMREVSDKVNARKEAHAEGNLDQDKAAEDWRKTDEVKINERNQREALHKEQMTRERTQKEDREKEDRQKAEDRQKEDLRAKTREHVKKETEKAVEKEMHEYKSKLVDQMQQRHDSGPALTPGVVNDPVKMAVAIDHPGLTDTEKAMANTAGWAVGAGWHEREAERKQELMQRERDTRDVERADRTQTPAAARVAEQGAWKDPDKDFFAVHFSRQRGMTPEARADQAVKDRDQAVSDVKENVRKDHEDQQAGETGKDIKERADLESTGKVTVTQAEEMTHGAGSKEHADKQYDSWFDKHETQELNDAGVSRDPADYEQEREREDEM